MLLFDRIAWPFLVLWIVSVIEIFLLKSYKYRIRLGLRLWSETLSDGYKLFLLSLNNDIISNKTKFLQIPEYIIKHNNIVKLYAKPDKPLLFVPIVAFINLHKFSPKISYHCPLLILIWLMPYFIIISLPLIILLLPSPADIYDLILITLIITLPLMLFYLYLNFRANRKSIHQFIDSQIESGLN